MPDNTVTLQPYNGTSQLWFFEQIDASYYRIKNTNGLCFDLDANTRLPRLNNCGAFNGQYWELITAADGQSFILKSGFTGPDLCLSVNEGADQTMQMAACDSRGTEMWQYYQAQ